MKPNLTGYEIESFEANYPDLASAISTKGGVMNIFSVIIIAIAGVGILNLLLMAIYERTREIGMLGAMGLKPGQISLLFILEGIMIGLVGVAVGIVLGLAINGLLMKVGLDFSSLSIRHQLHGADQGQDLSHLGHGKTAHARLTVVAIISALASVIPAIEAGRREPAEALHYV